MQNARNRQMDAHGFTRSATGVARARGYGRTTAAEIRQMLGSSAADDLFKVGIVNGVRSAVRVETGAVDVQPGDAFTSGPKCQLAAPLDLAALAEHIAGLRDIGFPQATASRSAQGVRLRLKGFTLPGGSRTDLMLVLPPQFPLLPPIGFYLRGDAQTGGLDLSHLFPNRAFHQAPNLSNEPEAWRWYCLIVEKWNPAQHTLAGFVGQISAALAAGQRSN